MNTGWRRNKMAEETHTSQSFDNQHRMHRITIRMTKGLITFKKEDIYEMNEDGEYELIESNVLVNEKK
jgi:hypothetical protein